jgi:multisubunit Na+/H+ antiporter MnhC subunit
VTGEPGIDLGRPRDASAIARDSLTLLRRDFGRFFLIGLAIVLPIQLAVGGVGLEGLTSGYREDRDTARAVVDLLMNILLITPLVTAATIYAVGAIAAGNRPHVGHSLQAAFEAFTPLFLAVMLAFIGIGIGLLALVVPGIYVAVRWYLTAQAVVVDELRGVEALRRSAQLVQDNWFRTAGVLLLANLIALVPALLIAPAAAGGAEAADSQAIVLLGDALTQAIGTPYVALVGTLLYYDLRARREKAVV